jgi:hypothetical protein
MAEFNLEGEIVEPCRAEADYLLPAITLAPTTDVLVMEGAEFRAEKSGDSMVLVHEGSARHVRIPSLVAVGRHLVLSLKRDGTQYCVVSSVALLGGSITIKGASASIGTISSVGNVRVEE